MKVYIFEGISAFLNLNNRMNINMADQAKYDNFCTQFRDSLLQEATGDPGDPNNWFGRLLRFRAGREYQMVNFFGKTYTESQFRDKLQNDEIKINVFEFTSPINYTDDLDNSMLATASVEAHIEATVDGDHHSGDFNITHKIRKAWQSYETTFE